MEKVCARWAPFLTLRQSLCRAGLEVAGMVTLKHLYEIALVKSQDPCFVLRDMPLEKVINSLIGTARSIGIKVVKE